MTIIDMPQTRNQHYYYYHLGLEAMLGISITKLWSLVLINLGAAELSRIQTLGRNYSDATM
jgi:hypothetical protein